MQTRAVQHPAGHRLPLALCFVLCGFAAITACHAQTLDEVMESEAMRKIQQSKSHTIGEQKEAKAARTHYESLWIVSKPGTLLLEWIGSKLEGFKLDQVSPAKRDEYAHVLAIFKTKEDVRIELTIQVPKPQYLTMAEYGTLVSFNRFKPPLLDVVADQTVPIQDRQAKYYRARDGSCSLLIKIEKQGIVNLRTKKCADSPIMMKAAKSLNLTRLDQKLTS
jgi:hypothetical protein